MGNLSKPLNVIKNTDIKIRAMYMADTAEFGILRLVVDKPEEAMETLKKNNILVKMTEIVAVQVDEASSGITDLLEILKGNGIELEYLYAFTYDKMGNTSLVLHAADMDGLMNALKENNINILSPTEVN